jgi:hypothetical protein
VRCAPNAIRPDVGEQSVACGVRSHPIEMNVCLTDTAMCPVVVVVCEW